MLIWAALSEDDSVLDIGCGGCQLLSQVNKHTHSLMGVEVSRETLEHGGALAKRSVVSDGQYLPFREGQFDRVLCSSSIEYFDDVALLREMRRVLKSDGSVLLTADSNTRPLPHYLELDFRKKNGNVLRFYTAASLWRAFQDAGLRPVKIQYLLNSWLSDLYFRLGIVVSWTGSLWGFLSLVGFYPCLAIDTRVGSAERGHTLLILARK